MPFNKLKGKCTEEKHCPSLNAKAHRQTSKVPAGMLVGQRMRTTVQCTECNKPRGVYSRIQLTPDEKKQLEAVMELVEYTCGSELTVDGGPLHGTVFVQTSLRCSDPVEFSYYACPRKQPDICCYCASSNSMRDPQLLGKFN